MQPKDPREVTNMPETCRAPKATLRLLPAALLLSIAGISLARPAVAAEARYDPGDKVYFTYCYAHPPALPIKPRDPVLPPPRTPSNPVFSPPPKTPPHKPAP